MNEPQPAETSARKGPPSHLLLIVGGLILAWCAYLYFLGPGTPTTQADYGLKLKDLDGKPIDFAQYRGRVVFLNFWATWCPPCRAEMPSIARLAADPRVKDVVFLLASTEDDPEGIRSYAKQAGLSLPFAIADGPPPGVFATDGIPATFVIARDGRIAISEVGSAEWDAPGVVAKLETLTKSP
jgi:thiol-disulfide isomerase/thioredoxin